MRNLFDHRHPLRFYSPDDVNSTAVRPEVEVDWPADGEPMPEQFGGARTTLMPSIYIFQTPKSFESLWRKIEVTDSRRLLRNGQPNPTFEKKVERWMLRFDRNNPLIVMGGPHEGEPLTWNPSTTPRALGRKDDPKTAWISELAFLLATGFKDAARSSSIDEFKAAINRHAGQPVRLETGLSGQCRADKVRYIRVETTDPATGQKEVSNIPDPTGRKGCGARAYTKDFKTPNGYSLEVECDCGTPTEAEVQQGVQAVRVTFRGFESVERVLPPIGG